MTMADPDQLTDDKNLYNISAGEVMWRNFLAGMSRALGGMLIYFLVIIVLTNVFLSSIWPSISPTFDKFFEATDLLKQVNSLQRPYLGQ